MVEVERSPTLAARDDGLVYLSVEANEVPTRTER
jgi:hypothetical protein